MTCTQKDEALAGGAAPGNDDARWQAGTETDKTNDDTETLVDLDADRKAFQTLRAHLALAGHALSRTDGSDGPCRYFVTRWGMVRELRDLDAVKRFAAQVGVA
ncbi:MAG: hypothetical protein K2Y02_03690 [Burkholderiaceae bacterium]|nr:hypothetical protein [Burkholderiaceae bacterium]